MVFLVIAVLLAVLVIFVVAGKMVKDTYQAVEKADQLAENRLQEMMEAKRALWTAKDRAAKADELVVCWERKYITLWNAVEEGHRIVLEATRKENENGNG